MLAAAAPPEFPLEFSGDFEFAPLGAAPSFATLSVEGKGDSIKVTGAPRGRRSLKLHGAPGLAQTYNPHFYYQPSHRQGFRFGST